MGPDPGQLRVRFAARLALMATLTVLGLIGANHWGQMPIGGIGLGFMVAQFNAAAVRDPTPGGQVVSSLVSGLAGLSGATLAALVAPFPTGSDVMLVVLVMAATGIRAAGPRAMAAGMLAFIGYYLNLIIHVPLGQVPLELAAVAYAVAVALLVRLVILPDRPRRALPRVLGSVRWQAARVLETVREMILTGGNWSERLVRRTARLAEAVEAAEDQIQKLGGKPAGEGWSRLAMTIVELQIQILRIARLCQESEPPADPALIAGLARASASLVLPLPERQPAQTQRGGLSGRIAEIRAALGRVSAIAAQLPASPDSAAAAAREPVSTAPEGGGEEPASPEKPPEAPLWHRLLPVVRQPLQVGVATGIAIVVGHAVSGRRWYWSVLATFIVFVGTMSRATTLTKAAQRVLGTLIGAGAGILIAEAVHGHPKLIIALALLADAFAFYAFQEAYSVMIFWITIMIALLYSLLGFFRPELLAIRFYETAVGAAAGIIIAILLLPQRTSDAMRTAGLQFLRTAGEALETLPGAARRAAQAGEVRKVARAIQDLRAAAGPLGRGWVSATPMPVRLAVQAAMAISYWMHELAMRLRDCAPEEISPHFRQCLQQLNRAAEQAREALEKSEPPPPVRIERDEDLDGPALAELAALTDAVDRYVQALDRATRVRRKGGEK